MKQFNDSFKKTLVLKKWLLQLPYEPKHLEQHLKKNKTKHAYHLRFNMCFVSCLYE